jgi:MFS transporter, ACS family, pantothenate transporter
LASTENSAGHQIFNFVGMVIVAVYPDYGVTFFGYMINAASWGYWPVLYAWINEICHKDAEERAIVIAVAQTFGQAFVAWVPGKLLLRDCSDFGLF